MQLSPLIFAFAIIGQGTLEEAADLVAQFGSWRRESARAKLLKFAHEVRRVALIQGLSHKDMIVQQWSAFGLSGFKDKATNRALEEYLPRSEGNGRVWAVYHLARTEYQLPVPILKEMLASDTEQQRAALLAIEKQGIAVLVRESGQMLESTDNNVGSSARRALIALGDLGFREIERQLRRGNARARESAILAINDLPTRWGERLMPVALMDKNPIVLRQALNTFSSRPVPSALPLVLRASRSTDREILGASIWALSAVRDPRSRARLVSLTSEPRFGTTAVYALSRMGDPSALPALARLRGEKLNEAFAATVLRYGTAGVPYAERLLKCSNKAIRLAIVRSMNKELIGKWPESDRDSLVRLASSRLHDPNPDVQDAALRALANMGKTSELPGAPFTDDAVTLAKAMVWDRTGYAVASLGLVGKRAVPQLLPLLRHPEGAVRARAALALGIIGDPETFAVLAALFSDGDPVVREGAAEAFVQIGLPGLGTLVKAAAHHGEAIYAARKLRTKSEDFLRNLLVTGQKYERLGALRILWDGESSQTAALRLLDDPEREVRYHAAMFMAILRDRRAVPVLAKLFANATREHRLEIIARLGYCGGPEAMEVLGGIYRKRHVDHRVMAEAMVRRGGVDDLVPLLSDPLWKVRRDAVQALGRLKDPRAIVPVESAIQDPAPEVRRSALYAVAELRSERALDLVLPRLDDLDRDVRWVAAAALGVLKDNRAVPSLIALVDSRDSYTCRVAAESLGRIGDRRATPALLSLLDDLDPYNRRFAARALGILGDPAALPALRDHLSEIFSEVAREAESAISQINGRAR